MSITSNSDVRSKYFSGQTDMDGSLSDFQEAKTSCKGPKPAVKTAKPKPKKVTKRAKGQRDIRTALKGKKNELVSYSKEFDTVCKKSGLDVDSEQLQLAIALSKSLQTESNDPETSQPLSSQQRVAKIRKTLQEYGFKVPEAKITVGRKTKKFRKNYKLLTVTEEEKHQKITGKYSRILFENLDNSKVEHTSSNDGESDARVFYIGSNIPYKCMKDNEIFYVENLVEKSVTNGSLLRDWSEIPGRPESPKHFETYAMNFKDIECTQDELDVVLSGKMKSVKDIFATKEIEFKKNHKECDVPKILIEEEEKVMNDNVGVIENKSPFQKAFNMKSPVKMFETRSPVKRLFQDKILTSEEVEIISPIKHPTVKTPTKEVLDIETTNKLTIPQHYRSCSPDIFDDELSSIMETTKPIIVLSQEYKTKVFSQEIMDLTQCAKNPSQNSEKGIQLSQNITKRRSNDFMEITECIVGSSQHIREEFKEIDLTQSPEDRGNQVEDHSINLVDNVANVSKNLSRGSKRNTGSTSQNITDEQQITVLSNHPHTDPKHTEKEDIDLTQSSNEDDREIKNIDEIMQTPDKKAVESMDLTQSSNSTDTSLPLVDVKNSQSQASLEDTIIVDKDEYIANGKVRKSFFGNEVVSQVFDLTQAPETSIEYNPSPVKAMNTESCSNSFYEDLVHEHSENTENSKEIINADVSKENSHSHNESKESNDDIDLTQDSSSSEEILLSQRPMTVLKNIPNNSSLGKQDDVSIDYDEIIIEDHINDRESLKENEKNGSLTQQYEPSKTEVNNDIEIVSQNQSYKETKNDGSLTQHYDSSKSEVNNDIEIVEDDNGANSSLSQQYGSSKSEVNNDIEIVEDDNDANSSLSQQYNSSKSEVKNDIEIAQDNNDADINSSQNSEVFQISDKELDYSLHKSRRDFSRNNFDFGGISVLENVTKLGSYRKSLSEGCLTNCTENKIDNEDSFLPEVHVKKTETKINETTQLQIDKDGGFSPIKVQEVLKDNNGIINIKTPKNTEYIIKTVDVTPMVDYASMSTPQRNRELDKYGLKPLKRKRAIQILTHLFNQTHPTVQQLAEDHPSPSKKPRTNAYTQESSPKKFITTPEKVKSPRKFVYKKPRLETRVKDSPRKTETEKDRVMCSGLSPIRSYEFERDSNSISATSGRTDELERNKAILSDPSSNRLDGLERDSNSVRCHEFERDSNSSSATSRRTDELERDRAILSDRLDGLERDSDSVSAMSSKGYDELDRDRDTFSAPTNEIKEVKDLCGYEVSSEVAVLKSIDCNPEDWVFQKREKAKVHSCRVPLHIAFHNYVLSRRVLREAILKYEPVNIDVIHKDLVGYGHRYDPKDLLKFMDKKCITVKTTDNNARNNRR